MIHVEIQCAGTKNLINRSITYAAKLMNKYSKQYEECNKLDDLKVISIWIIKDEITDDSKLKKMWPIEEMRYCFTPNALDKEFAEFSDNMRVILVQLPKFKGKEILDKCSKVLQDWVQFFLDPSKVENEDEGIKKAQYLWKQIGNKSSK